MKDIRQAYTRHRHNTHGRKDRTGREIKFDLSFEEWLRIWLDSGHFSERGRKRGQYVMSRIDDLGDYCVGNVEITTQDENHRQRTRRPDSNLKPPKQFDQECPHCGKVGKNTGMKRYHFDNCKNNTKS